MSAEAGDVEREAIAARRVRTLRGALVALLFVFFLLAPVLLPLFTSEFWVTITAEIMIWSLLAASVNLLFGFTGLLSFGQALYFGVGMYGVALGVSLLGLGFWAAFGFGIGCAVVMAALTGALAVRLTWHYFAIITVVFSLIFYFIAVSMSSVTGGDDGIAFTLPPLLSVGDVELSLVDPTVQYYFVFAVVGLCFLAKHRLLRSALGRALVSVRENALRAELIGIDVYAVRLCSFVAAGFLAGTSGALFALFGRYASASYMFYHVSGEAVVWAIVGGAGTLLGPVLGTAALTVLREELSLYWDHYLLLVGLVIILTVIFAPKGIAGLLDALLVRLTSPRRKAIDADDARPDAREERAS